MRKINDNWVIEGLIDFEYKKYLLLSYLQFIEKEFNDWKLFPYLADLVKHRNLLVEIINKKQLLQNTFSKTSSNLDFDKLQLNYINIINDDEIMEKIEEIIKYALPKIEYHIREGEYIYKKIDNLMNIESIGYVYSTNDSGFLLVKNFKSSNIHVYKYFKSNFIVFNQKLENLKTQFITIIKKNVFETIDQIALQVIRKYHNRFETGLSTYFVYANKKIPYFESLLPISKERLLNSIV